MQTFQRWAQQGQFWGKVRIDEVTGELQAWLPLAHHCIDVTQVFLELARAPYVRQHLSRLAGAPLSDAHLERLAAIIFFHDLGKLALGFQSKVFAMPLATAIRGHTADALTSLFSGSAAPTRVLANFPSEEMQTWFANADGLSACLQSVWSHHGQPVFIGASNSMLAKCHDELWRPAEMLDPAEGLGHLVQVCRQQLPAAFRTGVPPLHASVELQHHLAGLAMLVDWLGSNADVFALTGNDQSVAQRIEQAEVRARQLLRGTLLDGLDHVYAPFQAVPRIAYETLFAGSARPLQQAVAALDVTYPQLQTLVAESDTGSGKTEAALLWWAKLRTAGKVEGLYFALPTRVAARQLYERIVKFVNNTYPAGQRPVVLLAVPGYVQTSAADALAIPSANSQHHDDTRIATLGMHWASEQAKRFLAAPIVVGTIDQALLSTLQTNHAHLRAALLQRHLLVVDEVHSSDTYMRQLLKDVLHRRRKTGAYTLMLSATLGCEARQELLSLPNRESYEQAQRCAYPRMSGLDGFVVDIDSSEARHKQVSVTAVPVMLDLKEAARQVARAVRQGARVLVVLNTVKRARAMQVALETELGAEFEGLFRVKGQVCLHHGRFAAADREVLDAAVGSFLGEGSGSSARVLVGTQTLEQSLDIDADVLFTDLCPMDVLLQRIGRLWRHNRTDRPAQWAVANRAQCFLMVPPYSIERALSEKEKSRELSRAGLSSVYDDLRVLDLTWKYFTHFGAAIELPVDNRRLVEATVHSTCLDAYSNSAWSASRNRVWAAHVNEMEQARDASAANVFNTAFGEQACQFNTTLPVVTRLGDSTQILKLDRAVTTPFGQELTTMQIPGQDLLRGGITGLAPKLFESPAVISDYTATGFTLEWNGVCWRYDRMGLQQIFNN